MSYRKTATVRVSSGFKKRGSSSGMNRGNQLYIFGVCVSGTVESSTSSNRVAWNVPLKPWTVQYSTMVNDTLQYLHTP